MAELTSSALVDAIVGAITQREGVHLLSDQGLEALQNAMQAPTYDPNNKAGELVFVDRIATGAEGEDIGLLTPISWVKAYVATELDKIETGDGKTDLTVTRAIDSITIESSTGENAVIPVASDTQAGLMTHAMKQKVDAVPATNKALHELASEATPVAPQPGYRSIWIDGSEEAEADKLKFSTQEQMAAAFGGGGAVSVHDLETVSSGTLTPDFANGQFQTLVNGGAFTLEAPEASGRMSLLVRNSDAAGAINVDDFEGNVFGDAYATTDRDYYLFDIVTYPVLASLTITKMVVQYPEPAVPWTPDDEASLHSWHDASDAATITESGGSVSAWLDKTANDIDYAQADGPQQPQTGTRTLNGLNVIDFATAHNFDLGGFTWPSSSFQFIIVGEIDTVDNSGTAIIRGGGGANWFSFSANHTDNFGAVLDLYGGGNGDTAYTGDQKGAPHVFRLVFDFANNRVAVYMDGVLLSENVTEYIAAINGTELHLMGYNDTTNQADGMLAEVMMFASADNTIGEKAEGYAGHKWGLALDAGHTYFENPPMSA